MLAALLMIAVLIGGMVLAATAGLVAAVKWRRARAPRARGRALPE
jgi:hypothetical protein